MFTEATVLFKNLVGGITSAPVLRTIHAGVCYIITSHLSGVEDFVAKAEKTAQLFSHFPPSSVFPPEMVQAAHVSVAPGRGSSG